MFGIRKLESLALMRRCLRNNAFSRFDRTLANYDRRTDGHRAVAYAALA